MYLGRILFCPQFPVIKIYDLQVSSLIILAVITIEIDLMNFPNPEYQAALPVFSGFSALQAVYLFGSVANGKQHKESDIDFGFFAENNIYEELATALVQQGFSNFDLVYVPEANLTLQFEIIHKNHLIYNREDFDRGYWFSKILRMYFDFQPYREFQRQCLKERILDG